MTCVESFRIRNILLVERLRSYNGERRNKRIPGVANQGDSLAQFLGSEEDSSVIPPSFFRDFSRPKLLILTIFSKSHKWGLTHDYRVWDHCGPKWYLSNLFIEKIIVPKASEVLYIQGKTNLWQYVVYVKWACVMGPSFQRTQHMCDFFLIIILFSFILIFWVPHWGGSWTTS